MKTKELIIAVVLVATGVFSSVSGFAQTQGRVGINLILKPIQTLHVTASRYPSERTEAEKSNSRGGVQPRRVAAFGTTSFQLHIDSVFTKTVSSEIGERPRTVPADRYRNMYLGNRGAADSPVADKPLFIYSMQVR